MRHLFALVLASSAFAQPCTPSWSDQFASGGVNDRLFAGVSFDPDGAGPLPASIVVAGELTAAGGQPCNHIAMWDGAQWSPLGTGLNGNVDTLFVFDLDGSGPNPPRLLAGGGIVLSGSFNTCAVAVWDGATWSALDPTLFGGCHALTSFDDDGPGPNPPQLIAAGDFWDGVSSRSVARWNGVTWVDLGVPFDDRVYAAATFDDDGPGPNPPALYVGGEFTLSGATPVAHLARWNGSAWSQVGAGTNGAVRALAVADTSSAPVAPALYLGGSFSDAGGNPAAGIAAWNGQTFSALGAGLNGTPLGLSVVDDDGPGPNPPSLIACGLIGFFSLPSSNSIARWTGSAWLSMGIGFNAGVYTTFTHNTPAPRLIAVGDFTTASFGSSTTNFIPRVAQWDGAAWSPVGPATNGGLSDHANALAVHDEDGPGPAPEALYVGGRFTSAGPIAAGRIARWDGGAWSTVSTGFNSDVHALLSFDDDGPGPNPSSLYAGGYFTNAGGATAQRVAKWNGSSWSALGSGLGQLTVYTLAGFDEDGEGPNPPALFAGGDFGLFGTPPLRIARWTGTSWSQVGAGFNSTVRALATYDPDGTGPLPASLYAGGDFWTSGSTFINRIARWDGVSWQPLGNGAGGSVHALASFDPDGPGPLLPRLYVAGQFNSVGQNITAVGLASWNGSAWAAISGAPTGSYFALAVVDDDGAGPGLPALYAAGSVSGSLGFPPTSVRGIVRYSGTTWSALSTGLNVITFALAGFDDDGAGPRTPSVFAAGRLSTAGGQSSERIARWGCPAPVCYPNCDNSSAAPILNVSDFICFMNRYAAADPYANCDASTLPPILNVNDFICFLTRYAAGCN